MFVSYKLFEKVFEVSAASCRERDYRPKSREVLSGGGPIRN
jgi:hypothetical protein